MADWSLSYIRQQALVPEELLRAIAKVESGALNAATAENKNKDGTRDIGRMQINTGWLGALTKFGITEDSLRNECTSIQVGAWIMAHNVNRHGLSWDAVGAYNVGCKKLSKQECERRRNLYAWKVFRAIKPAEQKIKEEPVEMQAVKANESRIVVVTF